MCRGEWAPIISTAAAMLVVWRTDGKVLCCGTRTDPPLTSHPHTLVSSTPGIGGLHALQLLHPPPIRPSLPPPAVHIRLSARIA
jgi:hypothetical protein